MRDRHRERGRRPRHAIGAALLILGCATPAPAPPVTPHAPSSPPQLFVDHASVEAFQDPERRAKLAAAFPKIDALLAREMAAQKLPGLAFGIVVDGELAYARGLGVRDLETKAPVDSDTIFRIGSITKTFTAMAILQLRDAGKLSLDEPASRTLPELGELRYPTRDAAPITIRQLLTHHAGLPQFANRPHSTPGHAPTERELFSDVAHLAMQTAPGTTFAYSTLGIALLGTVISRVSGVSYRDYVTTRIFEPLGMRSSFFDDAAVPKQRLATGYVSGAAGPRPIKPWLLGSMEAAGGMYTSLRDLGRYAAFQLAAYPPRDEPDTGPLRRSSVREAHAGGRHISLAVLAHEPTEGSPSVVRALSRNVGLVWYATDVCDMEPAISHSGNIDGFASRFEMYPQRGVAVIVLSNHNTANLMPFFSGARDLMLASGGLAPRVRAVSPVLARTTAALLDLYGTFREDLYRQVYAPVWREAFPMDDTVRDAARVRKEHGACRNPHPIEVTSPWSGRFLAACDRGGVEVDLQLDADGRIVDVSVESRDTPPAPKCPERPATPP